MNNYGLLRSLEIGAVELKVKAEPDTDGSMFVEDYGKYTSDDFSRTEWIYSRTRHAVRAPGSYIWRNERGQFISEEEPYRVDRNSYEYIKLSYADNLPLAFKLAERIEQYGTHWCYMDLTATIYIDGVEISTARCGGIEDDSDQSYILEVSRDLIHQACEEARAWLDRRK